MKKIYLIPAALLAGIMGFSSFWKNEPEKNKAMSEERERELQNILHL